MGTNVVMDVTGKLHDMYVLRKLYNFYQHYTDICETEYLRDFSLLETSRRSDPKFIIRDVSTIHMRCTLKIFLQPNRLENLIFMCHEEDKNVRKFEFSNNMTFSNDIVTLCFLYHVTHKRDYDECGTVQNLKSLILNKYEICFERNNTEATQQQNIITLSDIASSFPSVTWDMTRNLEWWIELFDTFSDFEVPKLIFLPKISSLLPHLNEQPPLEMVLVAALRVYKSSGKKLERVALRDICKNISTHYKRKRFPESLKLYLCKKWKIVILEKCIHKYSPSFAAYRHKAKAVITEIKPDDPDLKLVLFTL